MTNADKIVGYYAKVRPFREEIGMLRALALKTEALETFKWNGPVYTVNNRNVFGIMAFKRHFGLWFFNGVFLKDPAGVLEAAQESTKAMRHWKFHSRQEIDTMKVLSYMEEAIENQKKGLVYRPAGPRKILIPPLLEEVLKKDMPLKMAFQSLAPYRQREYCDHIASAKLEKTRIARLEKSILLIRKGLALNDAYR